MDGFLIRVDNNVYNIYIWWVSEKYYGESILVPTDGFEEFHKENIDIVLLL